jgi:hypothetical protein
MPFSPRYHRKTKILLILACSFFISKQMDETFFIAHSPTVNVAAVYRFMHPELPTIDSSYIASTLSAWKPQTPAIVQDTIPRNTVQDSPYPPAQTFRPDGLSTTPEPTLSIPTPIPTPIQVHFVASQSLNDQRILLQNAGFTPVGAAYHRRDADGSEELVIPPATSFNTNIVDEEGVSITILSPQ